MPQPLDTTGGEGEAKVDIFESSPAVPKVEDNKKDTDTKEKTVEKTATEIALEAKVLALENDKKTMGENLSNQGKLIDDLRKGKHLDKDGKPTDVVEDKDIPVPYKAEDIKFSKDLSEDERDAMTKTEIALFDALADMKQKANEQAVKDFKKEREMIKNNEKDGEVKDLNGKVKEIALSLVGNDIAKANEIIESAKRFNLVGLDEATLKARIEDAQKLLPDYKPPKEQEHKDGGVVKNNDSTKDDPFGSTKIIEEAQKGNKGNYSL